MTGTTGPTLELMIQIDKMQTAIATLKAAIDDLTGSIIPEEATWKDVSRYAHLIDGLARADLVA